MEFEHTEIIPETPPVAEIATEIITPPVTDSRWKGTIVRMIPCIVSIRSVAVRSFDTETSRTSQATGFVVDCKQGIILTNRHVVQPGPILAEAIFSIGKEEVKLTPIYRDPLHDFGFFKFDVNSLKYAEISQINLRPDLAHVGLEIRVIGNDSGERLSILSGTLARLDREAPFYGNGKYNDWNTFYYQAASMTSGGSSGSPVIDILGNAVALNAGGSTRSASSYFLPLDRVSRALELIQTGQHVTRGTLQTIFRFTSYDELRRLGIDQNTESELRKEFSESSGLLKASNIVPGGPVDKIMASGDILLKINDKWIMNFLQLENVLDSFIGETIKIHVQRGRKLTEILAKVQDLHTISPQRFVEVGGGILHDLSYHMAASFVVKTGSVFVASPGYIFNRAGIGRFSIIHSVNNEPTPTIECFIHAMSSLKNNERVPIQFYPLGDVSQMKFSILQTDWSWHNFSIAHRNDVTGLWDYKTIESSSVEHVPPVQKLLPSRPMKQKCSPIREIADSLVFVEFHLPFLIDGIKYSYFSGSGLIIDAEIGLVVAGRNTVPTSLGDIMITFSHSVLLPAYVIFIHEIYNFAILKYDPSLLGSAILKDPVLSKVQLSHNDPVNLVCFLANRQQHEPIVRKTSVSNIRNFFVAESIPPAYRPMNMEGVELENPVNSSGVIVNDDGHVQALYLAYSITNAKKKSTFFMGLSINVLLPALSALRAGKTPAFYFLEVELSYLKIAHATSFGLKSEWIEKLQEYDDSGRNVAMIIRRVTSGTEASKMLQAGDILLQIGDKIVTRFNDVMQHENDCSISLKILREKQELVLTVPLSKLNNQCTDRIVSWAGAIFQQSHKPAYQQLPEVPQGVFCAGVSDGSPANLHGLVSHVWISEINHEPVFDLDTLIRIIKKHSPDEYLCLKLIFYNKFEKLVAIKTDVHYFRSWEIKRLGKDWSLQYF